MKEQILAVQRMQEYIEAHLSEEITLAGLAQASLFSPWHSYRLFRAHLGLTPAEYVRRLRLPRSAMRLRAEHVRVVDVAADLGFGSVDGFQRAFLREFGCNPGDYARTPVPIPLFIPYGVKFRELRKEVIDMEALQSVFVQLVRKPARRAVIRRGIRAEIAVSVPAGLSKAEALRYILSLDPAAVCRWEPAALESPPDR